MKQPDPCEETCSKLEQGTPDHWAFPVFNGPQQKKQLLVGNGIIECFFLPCQILRKKRQEIKEKQLYRPFSLLLGDHNPKPANPQSREWKMSNNCLHYLWNKQLTLEPWTVTSLRKFMTVPRTPQITIQEKTDEINTSHQVYLKSEHWIFQSMVVSKEKTGNLGKERKSFQRNYISQWETTLESIDLVQDELEESFILMNT
ncbi:hypothetical protein MG293_003902 [Ovis ammon polii]|uniref:Uncharacterized protein n=1 Tax=Ovis ammon polii TaxID=230172 RepID=A0AAD4YHE1_OVIAM|nr:hypothetical protein MG293_003902 [Ovis ammon polii]KAI4577492.1 hypothetical protein MJT46_003327 [Ovis ammon polii x Ovis aries]